MLNKSEVFRKLIDEYDVKTTKGVQKMLKYLFAGIITTLLHEMKKRDVYNGLASPCNVEEWELV